MATPVPTSSDTDWTGQRAEQMEADMRRRAERIQQQMQDRARQVQQSSSRTRQEAQDKIDKVRAKSAGAERIRAAEQASRKAASADAAASPPSERPTHRVAPAGSRGRPAPMPEHLKALLSQPNWRSAVIMAEILGPPVALRDPDSRSATMPPSLAP